MTSAQRWTLIAAILGSGIVFLDSTVVSVALPKIGRELPSTAFGILEGQSYVYNGYLLTLSSLLILAGALTDHFGRRRTYALGLGGFFVTSLLCGVAPTMELLIAGRVLQGVAGALLVPGSLALIKVTFSGEAQGRAFGIWAGASAATTVLGPFVVGMLVDGLSWRAAFLINLPLCALALWATLRYVRESRDDQVRGRFDWLGAAVVAVAVGGLSFGTIYGEQREWRAPLAFALLGLGAVAAIALPALMLKRAAPLIPPHLFRSRNFTVANLSTFLIYGALYVVGYFLTLFLQGTIGYSAAAAGLGSVPAGLFLMILSSRFGLLAARHGPRRFLAIGPGLMALGVAWYARIPASSAPWQFTPADLRSYPPPAGYLTDVLPGNLLFGLGLAMLAAPLTAAVMASVPVRNSGVASAINNAISRVGLQLAGTFIFVVITSSFYAGLEARDPTLDTSDPEVRRMFAPLNLPAGLTDATRLAAVREASTGAFHLAMLVGAGLLAAGAAANLIGIRTPAPQADSPGGPISA